MSSTDLHSIYNKLHFVPIYENNRLVEEREVVISICDIKERDILQVKVKDPKDFSFNYSESLDLSNFEAIRNSQNLDINFGEFKIDLIEMLQQNQKKEMYLKIENFDGYCTLVFYGKSKIKFITYLTLDLKMTNQKEIFNELNNNLKQIQDINDRLKWQITNSKSVITEKEQIILNLTQMKKNLEAQFLNNIKQIESIFKEKLAHIEIKLVNKLKVLKNRLENLFLDVNTLRKESNMKAESSQRLLKSMENLRLETIENTSIIDELKKENSTLQSQKYSNEKIILELQKTVHEYDRMNKELQLKNEDLRSDLEKVTIIIAQKKETNDELARDLNKANTMLRNFNNHYDMKLKQIDELNDSILTKEKMIQEQRIRYNELLKDFETYKNGYNFEEFTKLKSNLNESHKKIEELEKNIRKMNKMNGLLTQRMSGNHLGAFNNN